MNPLNTLKGKLEVTSFFAIKIHVQVVCLRRVLKGVTDQMGVSWAVGRLGKAVMNKLIQLLRALEKNIEKPKLASTINKHLACESTLYDLLDDTYYHTPQPRPLVGFIVDFGYGGWIIL